MIPIFDPRTIPQAELPLMVLSNQTNSWIGNIIDFRTDINGDPAVDHAMLSINAGKFVCQSPLGYNEIPMDGYLIKGGQLWFVGLDNADNAFDIAFRASVLNKLNGPAILKTYDFLGILGQAIGCPWIHTPFLDYCSVDVISHLKHAKNYLPDPDRILIDDIPAETNPEKLMDIVLKNPNVFKIVYTWDSEKGIVV